MANTSAVYARIDTNLKDNAEGILSQLGISPSSAIQMLYSQIVLNKGMPFELRLPSSKPSSVGAMTRNQLDAKLQKGVDSIKAAGYILLTKWMRRLQRSLIYDRLLCSSLFCSGRDIKGIIDSDADEI